MKNKIAMLMLACATSFFVACNGDHSDRNGGDTAKNKHDSIPSNIDTTATTTTTGDAGALDNSASGGTKIAKPDSTKKQDNK